MKLTGLKVIDLSLFLPGPHLTMMMADHGAEIIKVEPPGEGEPNRHIGPSQGNYSIFFRNTHRGKKSLCLNLKLPEGREVLLRLCETADVFIEAFRPGVVDRLGIGYTEVSSRNPKIIYCSISAFGQNGPYRDIPAHDLATEALAGIISLNLGADGEPTMPAVPAADMAASMLSFSGILMALYRREKTGCGDYIDVAMHDSILAWTSNVLGDVFANQRPPIVKNQRSLGGSAFYNIYKTSDARHIVLGAQEIKFVRNLLNELGRPEFIALCEQGPGAHQQPLIDFLSETFARKTRVEWIAWFKGRDISFAPVNNLREAFNDPHVQARSMRLTDIQGFEHIGVPVKFTNEPGSAQLTLPSLGEHTREILSALGYNATQIESLITKGAVVSAP